MIERWGRGLLYSGSEGLGEQLRVQIYIPIRRNLNLQLSIMNILHDNIYWPENRFTFLRNRSVDCIWNKTVQSISGRDSMGKRLSIAWTRPEDQSSQYSSKSRIHWHNSINDNRLSIIDLSYDYVSIRGIQRYLSWGLVISYDSSHQLSSQDVRRSLHVSKSPSHA